MQPPGKIGGSDLLGRFLERTHGYFEDFNAERLMQLPDLFFFSYAQLVRLLK